MAGSLNQYNLGSAEARITINTSQFSSAIRDAEYAADRIETELGRIVTALNAMQSAAGTGQADAMKQQIESLKLVSQQVKLVHETEKRLQSEQHKEQLAQLRQQSEVFSANHKQRMAEIAAETEQINRADQARRKSQEGQRRGKSVTPLEREQAGAQANSLLQVAQRAQEATNNARRQLEQIRSAIQSETGDLQNKRLQAQADSMEQVVKRQESRVRQINDLRKTARQDPVGMDLLTDRQREDERKIREESERARQTASERSAREQQSNARRLFQMQDRQAREERQRQKREASEAVREQRDIDREQKDMIRDRIADRQQLTVPDKFRGKLFAEEDMQEKEQQQARQQLQRDIRERRQALNQQATEEKGVSDQIASAREKAQRQIQATQLSMRRRDRDESAAYREEEQRNQRAIKAQMDMARLETQARKENAERDRAPAKQAAQSYNDAMARARAEQANLRRQLQAGKAQAPEVVGFEVDEASIKRLEADLADIAARAVTVQQNLDKAFTPDEIKKYSAELKNLTDEFNAFTRRQANTLANIQSNTTGGTLRTPNAPTITTQIKGQQNATRLAIAEAVKTISEIEARFKAARVGLPISVDTTDMERKLAQAQEPVRELKVEMARLQRAIADALLAGDVNGADKLKDDLKGLEDRTKLVTSSMSQLSAEMDEFDNNARKAVTGVRGYFNSLRIELERINQNSIGANLQQLGFNLLPMGAVGALATRRGIGIAQTIEETEIGFRGITNSASEARGLMAELADEARRFGLPIISSVPEFQKLLPIVNQLGYDIKDFVGYAARLATLNPAQGIEGAVRAISELASGSGNDFVSIAERFNISRTALRQAMEETGKNIPEALDRVLTAYGRTNEVALEFGQTSRAAMTRLQDAVDQFLAQAAEPLLDAFTPLLETATGLFNVINGGGGTLQTFTGIALAGSAAAITLTVALGQLLIAVSAIEAAFNVSLLATLGPVAVAIAGIVAAVGLALAGIVELNRQAENARVEAARASTAQLGNELNNLSTFGREPVQMSLMQGLSIPAIGSFMNNLQQQIAGTAPIKIPMIPVLEEPISTNELMERGAAGDPSGLAVNNRTQLNALISEQYQSTMDFASAQQRLYERLRDESRSLLSPLASGINASLGSVRGDSVTRDRVQSELDAIESSPAIEQFRRAFSGAGAISPQMLSSLNPVELAAIAKAMLGEGSSIYQSLQVIADNFLKGEINAQQINDALTSSAALIQDAESQLAIYERALSFAGLMARQDISTTAVRGMNAGAFTANQFGSIMGGLGGMSVQQLQQLNEGLSQFVDMMEELNVEIQRTLEDRARSSSYEISDFQLQRGRALEDYARNQGRAEADYLKSRNQMILDFNAENVKAAEEFEKQKAKLTNDANEEAKKALVEHLIDMQRMSRDVDDAIAARDFLSAQKQLQAMRDRQEDFDREAGERKKQLDDQLEELKKNLDEQTKERQAAFDKQLKDADEQYRLQRQRQDEDFRLGLQREDEDRRIRLWRQEEEFRIMDSRRIEDFNRQVRSLVAHNEVMRFNQSYWNGILEQDYAAFFNRVHQGIVTGAAMPAAVGSAGQLPNMAGNTGGLPANVYANLVNFLNATNSSTAGRTVGAGFIPQYASGIDFITREGLAYLHYGERVSKSADGVKERTGQWIDKGSSFMQPIVNVTNQVTINGNAEPEVVEDMFTELEYRMTKNMTNAFEGVLRKMQNE